MRCHDARERLSDWLDEASSAQERAELGAHLDGCPECRRELDRLRATVGILSRVERPRAPAGFVDRVIARACPVPWHRKLARRLFLPLGVKLPVEAAAMLVVAVLGVYLLQRTPELRDAARPDLQSPASRTEPLPAPVPRQEPPTAAQVDSGKVSETAPKADRETDNAVGARRRLDSAQPSPPAPQDYRQEAKKEAGEDRLQEAPAPTSQPAPALRAVIPGASAPAAPPAESARSGALGRLNTKDRPAAEKELTNLLAKVGGAETGRRQELGATVIGVVVPEARYAEFVRGLTALGAFTLEGQPAALPTDPAQVRFSIRLSE